MLIKLEEMTEEQTKAFQNFQIAQKNVSKCIGGKPGMSSESKYGDAFQKCVQLGIFRQLGRSRYRGR